MTKSSMLRVVEDDRAAHEIVERRLAGGHQEADGARRAGGLARGALVAVSARQVRSYIQPPPAASAAARFCCSASGVQ